jgi:hypothetical protein
MPVEELGLRRREQSFSRSNRTSVARGDGEGFKIERVTNVLKPPLRAIGEKRQQEVEDLQSQ